MEAAKHGIRAELVERRIREKGWAKKIAISKAPRMKQDRTRITEIAKNNGITYSQLKARLYNGWDEERASTTLIRNQMQLKEHAKKMAEMRRKYPKDLVDRAKANGVSYVLFRYRITHGWAMDDAVQLPPSRNNSPIRLKQKHGEEYFRKQYELIRGRRWPHTLSQNHTQSAPNS